MTSEASLGLIPRSSAAGSFISPEIAAANAEQLVRLNEARKELVRHKMDELEKMRMKMGNMSSRSGRSDICR